MKTRTKIKTITLSFILIGVFMLLALSACGITFYTVTFNPNYGGAQAITVSVEEGQSVERPEDPAREGYRFDGWFTFAAASEEYDFTKKITADTTVYAGWTQIYTIKFDVNYEGGAAFEQKAAVGEKIDTPQAPERVGYAFKGWFTDKEGGAAYNFNAAPVKDMTLYAHWAEAYTVTIVYNYEGAPENEYYYAEKGVTSSGPVSPERVGYAFNGWYSDAACLTSFSFARPISSDVTIYAGWKKQFVMEAEYIDFTGMGGPGYSGSVTGTDMIGWDRGGALGASNGYYVSYLYKNGQTLTFDFTSDAAVTDADIVIRISAEFYEQTFSSANYTVELNGSPLPWNEVTINGVENPAFIDVVIGKQLTLTEGSNTIKLITNNSTAIGGTMTASAPLVDCVKIATSANLTWMPKTSNIE